MQKQTKRWWVFITIMWAGLIYMMTEMPYFNGESTSTAIKKTIDTTEHIQQKVIRDKQEPAVLQPADPSTIHLLNYYFRKSAHILVFGILAVLIYKCVEPRRLSYLLALLLTFSYALFDEWHQSFVPGRTSAFKDVLFDTAGASMGLLLLYIFIKTKNNFNPTIRN
jgi:VanZ family protein